MNQPVKTLDRVREEAALAERDRIIAYCSMLALSPSKSLARLSPEEQILAVKLAQGIGFLAVCLSEDAHLARTDKEHAEAIGRATDILSSLPEKSIGVAKSAN